MLPCMTLQYRVRRGPWIRTLLCVCLHRRGRGSVCCYCVYLDRTVYGGGPESLNCCVCACTAGGRGSVCCYCVCTDRTVYGRWPPAVDPCAAVRPARHREVAPGCRRGRRGWRRAVSRLRRRSALVIRRRNGEVSGHVLCRVTHPATRRRGSSPCWAGAGRCPDLPGSLGAYSC